MILFVVWNHSRQFTREGMTCRDRNNAIIGQNLAHQQKRVIVRYDSFCCMESFATLTREGMTCRDCNNAIIGQNLAHQQKRVIVRYDSFCCMESFATVHPWRNDMSRFVTMHIIGQNLAHQQKRVIVKLWFFLLYGIISYSSPVKEWHVAI